jgi:hypothetical protein
LEVRVKQNGKQTLGDVVRRLDDVVEVIGELKDEVRRGFAAVNQRIEAVNQRIDGTNRRIDKVVENTGGHYRSHENRITALERDVARLKKA